ncbi:MAG: hypothetical protein PHC38_11705 [Weeksellaceae bacterium]|jgi:hypothetical protein|nr:hypothetical protein [Weeksellaceae bacterium]
MSTIDINKRLVDTYYSMLKNLSQNNKLELIERLSNSIRTSKSKEAKTKDSLDSLYGSWESQKSADEIIKEIENSRNFNRKEIKL